MSSTNEIAKIIRVGSRKSQLALTQTKFVIARLQGLYPDTKFEIHTMTTVGDRVLNQSLPKIGEKSLFTKDLEEALTKGGVDFVVHSLKDLPTSLPLGMTIGAVLEREDPRDVLVLNEKYAGKTLQTLPEGCTIGTSSLRRTAQLKRSYSHLKVCDIRGNLNTRLAKLDAKDSQFAGIILAQAGLQRMGWESRISQILEPDEILYAVGQGALAVECRSNDEYILDMLASLCHLETQYRILTERSFLKTLGGGCSAPVAVFTKFTEKTSVIEIKGAVWSLDGKTKIEDSMKRTLEEDEESQCKRAKLNSTLETPSKKEPNDVPKQESPKVVDESASTSTSDSMAISKLMDIHGDLFKKCPFSGQVTATTNNNAGGPDFPIGQDFMGECPYFRSDEQKVDALKLHLKCPITDQKENAEKCPFIAEQHRSQEESVNGEENGVKMIDYNEQEQQITNVPELVDNSSILYCGMFRQNSVAAKLFGDCEGLGKELAQNLIKLGALEVMHEAQIEVRKKA